MLQLAKVIATGRGAQLPHVGRRAATISISTQFWFWRKSGGQHLPSACTVVALELQIYGLREHRIRKPESGKIEH